MGRFYSIGTQPYQSFEPFPSQCCNSYRVRLEDIGRCLKCECTVTDVFGRSTGPVSAVTSPILPGYFHHLLSRIVEHSAVMLASLEVAFETFITLRLMELHGE